MNAMDAYAQQAASTASPAQLVLMLYDGALARVTGAQQALAEPVDVSAAHTSLTKAQAIVHELLVTLDVERGGEVAANLASIYTYVAGLLVEVNLSKDPAALTEVVDLLTGIRDAWEQACVQRAVAVAG
jgi:flagellar secretion chaperone FliS